MVAGFFLALGTTQLWLVADALLLTFVALQGRQGFKTHPIVVGIAVIISASAIWSPDPPAAALAGLRIVLLYSAARSVRSPAIWRGVVLVLGLQLLVAGYQMTFLARPHGLSANASQLGQTGMVFMYGPAAPIAAITLGLSSARAAAMGLFIWTLFRRSKYAWAMAGLAAVVFVSVIYWKTPDRATPAGIVDGIAMRADIANGEENARSVSAAELLEKCGERRERKWSWHGYGYHGYCAATGQQRPHNFFILSWWDLGVLAVPLWALVAVGAWKTRRPEWLALLAMSMITEEMFGRPEGFYMIAAMAMLRDQPVTARWWDLSRVLRLTGGPRRIRPQPESPK